MTTYWLDCDLHGADSIADLIEAGKVKHIECPSYKAFNKAVEEIILGGTGPDDLVVVDTVTSLLDTTRMDAKLGTDDKIDLFERGVSKYLGGDPNYLNVYNFAQSVTMRRLKNLRGRNIPVIVVAHEGQHKDENTLVTRLAPDVNPAMVTPLIGASSDVFRLFKVQEDLVGKDQTIPRGTRVLYLQDSDTYAAKFNVPRAKADQIPKYILDPTMPKLYETLGKKPVFLTLYGAPGSGKTTLATSAVATTPKPKGK